MKKYRLFAVTLLLGACQSKKTELTNPRDSALASAKRAIAESNRLYWQAFENHDSALFIGRYAADACIMPDGVPALCGPDAPAAFYRVGYQQLKIRNGRFTTQGVWGSGNYVTEQGRYELRDGRGEIMGIGKYLVLWKQTAAGWKMYRDSFSSDQPAAPAPAGPVK